MQSRIKAIRSVSDYLKQFEGIICNLQNYSYKKSIGGTSTIIEYPPYPLDDAAPTNHLPTNRFIQLDGECHPVIPVLNTYTQKIDYESFLFTIEKILQNMGYDSIVTNTDIRLSTDPTSPEKMELKYNDNLSIYCKNIYKKYLGTGTQIVFSYDTTEHKTISEILFNEDAGRFEFCLIKKNNEICHREYMNILLKE